MENGNGRNKDEFVAEKKRLGVVALAAEGELTKEAAWGILEMVEDIKIKRGWLKGPALVPKRRPIVSG